MTMEKVSHEEAEDSRSRRIMADLTRSLISQMDPSLSISLRPHHSSLLHTRIQHLFHSFHTPTHPPYALMIRRAIMELNEGNGSTEEAISEFVKKEYTDLPWAHGKILDLHLEKLCRVGELACGEGGRYTLMLDGEETEQRKGSRKGKRSKRRSNHGGGERNRDSGLLHEGGIIQGEINGVSNDVPSGVLECTQETHTQPTGRVEVSQKEQLEVVGEQSQRAQAEARGPTELEDSRVKMMSISSNLSLLQQGIPKGKLDENSISMGSELKPPKRPRGRPCKSEFGLHDRQKPYIFKMEKQHQYSLRRGGGRPGRGQGRCSRGRSRGRGRPPKVNQNQIDNQCGEQI